MCASAMEARRGHMISVAELRGGYELPGRSARNQLWCSAKTAIPSTAVTSLQSQD